MKSNICRLLLLLCCTSLAHAKWITAWTGAVQGPYPTGNASGQPVLTSVFPVPEAGARDQSFRMILRPDIWGPRTRVRLSNALGTKPVTFDGVYAGVQLSGAAVVAGTNRTVLFAGKPSVTVAPGESTWSDAVALNFAGLTRASLNGRKMAVSFHVAGESGPMTWHAKSLTTSHLTGPGAGSKGREETEVAFPFSTTSWYFVNAVDMEAPNDTRLIVAFGDSITDGTASTLNGDDRWPDVLSRRLHAAAGDHLVIVNAGIGGNRVVGPAEYTPAKPFAGGPSAGQRLERDVLSLSGVSAVIWLEGINDFNRANNESVEAVEKGMREIAGRIRVKIPGVKIMGATVTSAVGGPTSGPETDGKRKALNEFIRSGQLFDAFVDFDKATIDPQTGELRAEFVPESTLGGPGDKLHPNRAGYQAMGMAVDLDWLLRKPAAKGK
jgi:lysophospholipase L1-like esterase